MRIKRVQIKNFRGLERVNLEAGPGLNVIAGPNAIGKTTILEAIRLCKALLAQRFEGEVAQVLTTLGATLNGQISLNGPFVMLANDATKPIEIDMVLSLHDEELSHLKSSVDQLAVMMLQTELARSLNDSVINLTQYLSTIEGQNRLAANREVVAPLVAGISATNDFSISAVIDVNTGQVRGQDPNAQSFVSFLERTLTPNQTHFNYFTADRALPTGEVGIQLGAGDVQQQIVSYLAQPAVKWQRIKQLIIQTMLFDENGRSTLEKEFNLIFDDLLPGKRFSGVSLNENSVLRVLVEDTVTKKIFDIDSMSSGEKGLVLTFLTLRLSSKNNTIVMLDEPELHLNAAVCSRIVKYMKKHCVDAKGLQLFVCSHSPEIVRDAFEDDSCTLYHLRSPVDLSPVYQSDSREVFEILARLGASTADVLFSRGSIFVEGEHDAALIQAGYPETIQGFRIQALGGRSEVEKDIPQLQQKDREGKLDKKQLFIFDRDRMGVSNAESLRVKVYQLERYCIENYLLDDRHLYDEVSAAASKQPASRGEFTAKLEEMALSQLDNFIIGDIYKGLEPTNAGLRPKELQGKTFAEAADTLWNRLAQLRSDVEAVSEEAWKSNFLALATEQRQKLEGEWKSGWKILANGKTLIDDLYREFEINKKKVEFKKSVIIRMHDAKSELWRVLNSILDDKLNR